MFKYTTYDKARPKLLQEYVNNITAYLKLRFPTKTVKELENFVKIYVEQNIKRPKLEIINYFSYGNARLEKVDLLDYTNSLGNRITTPSGTVYKTPQEQESLIKLKIVDNIAARKIIKKEMLHAANIGDTLTEQRSNFKQSSVKIETNAISGAMNSTYNSLFDVSGYSATTSIGRHAVMCGYAHVEKFICGNYYFPTLKSVFNYLIVLHKETPSNINDIVLKYNLYVPTKLDLYNYIIRSTYYYQREKDISIQLHEFIDLLPQSSITFAFYANSFYQLITNNDTLMRQFIKSFFSEDITINITAKPEDVFKQEDELLALALSVNSELIQGKPLTDAVKLYPDNVIKLVSIIQHMERKLFGIEDLIETFFRVNCDTSEPMNHPNIIRNSVIVSDTDSVIFTTQPLISWYVGGVKFNKQAEQMNAFGVYMVSKTLEHVFARMSAGFGITGKDISKISMKNEFTFPVFLRTPASKTYVEYITVQEGKVLPKPKLNMKGLMLRGSDISAISNKRAKEFAEWLFNEVKEKGTITTHSCISKVVAHEQDVYQSLMRGERTFIGMATVKQEKEYADALQSDYFYYLLWQHVFADRFGPFLIPNKGFDIKIISNGKQSNIREPDYLSKVETYDPHMHKRLLEFLDKYPKRPITCIIIPPAVAVIPEIIRPLMDTRKIIYGNLRPLNLLMRALGLALSDSDYKILYSDVYDSEGLPLLY